jgi:hypothetical protein
MQVYPLSESFVYQSKQGNPSSDPAWLDQADAQSISRLVLVTDSLDFTGLKFVADDTLQKTSRSASSLSLVNAVSTSSNAVKAAVP